MGAASMAQEMRAESHQEDNIGLFNAIKAFAKKPSGVFSDYAASFIDDAISKAVSHPMPAAP
jgi:DNA-directed RNA polymerase sigma subunit (sigma70/sigma32)